VIHIALIVIMAYAIHVKLEDILIIIYVNLYVEMVCMYMKAVMMETLIMVMDVLIFALLKKIGFVLILCI